MKHFINTQEYSRAQLEEILDRAREYKIGLTPPVLGGKSVGLLFFNPSLRTRVSFEVGIHQLGGNPVTMTVGGESWNLEHRDGIVMDGDKPEHIKDAARVLSRYVDIIGVRAFPKMESLEEDMADSVIEAFRKYSDVPVVNLESSLYHPCQAMADVMTIREMGKKKVTMTWAYHPKALPMAVPNSFALIASQFGMDLTMAWPKEFPLSDMILDQVEKNLGAKPKIVHDPKEGLQDAEIVYAKSWGGIGFYGHWEEEKKLREDYRDWQVTEIPEEAHFMHCLPVRRNVVVSDEILDRSKVYDQAENRRHVQKAILSSLIA
ncbi:MAG: N-acetylornithine carbamoyltransferase [Planctomycetota bacterium]|jgi:N-acetylornithine carbamoyltransferase|nr:N-acetylornithine carbamoyltransferase [Planctomycetota bacterium]